MSKLSALISELPRGPGVYLFFDAAARLLYVGKSIRVRQRVQSYFREDGGHSRRTARLKSEVARIETQMCGSELEAMLLESDLIRTRMPLYNVQGRRCRHYPFIKIYREEWPRVELTYEMRDDGSHYFGPFTGEHQVKEVLDALRSVFRWRSCSPMASRTCFEHTVGRCSAPCVGAVSPEAYDAQVAELGRWLAGVDEAPLRRVESEMKAAADALEFERAAVLRDRLTILRPWWERRRGVLNTMAELEVLVVLPGLEPATTLWLLIRRGRLVHTERDVRVEHAAVLREMWARKLAEPPPSLAVKQEELGQINLLVGWLHRQQRRGPCVSVTGRSLEDTLAEAWTLARGYAQVGGVHGVGAVPISERCRASTSSI